MPKRRSPKAGITPEQIEYLCKGYAYFDPKPFENEAAARRAWEQYRDEVLALRDADHDDRPSPGAHFESGTRPWAWWRFDQDRDVPRCQGFHLLQLGELDEEEQATAIRRARAQAEEQNGMSPPEELDEFLLWVWPQQLRLFNEKGKLAPWIRDRHQRALTAEDLGDMSVDATTAYALVHAARHAARGAKNRKSRRRK